MSIDRRGFLRMAGLAALGAVGAPASKATGALPQESPLTGSRWAMAVDTRKCRENGGCNDCAIACHSVHNVPKFDDKKDELKWIWREKFHYAFGDQDHAHLSHEVKESGLPLLCNHCDKPPCTKVCPTQATWKREKDGVVMMDWHRCIGCRYCVAACPYGSRSFNWRDPRAQMEKTGQKIDPDFPTRTRGVVEKCTFCEERLAKGQLPACVEACTHGALTFGDLEDPDSEVRKVLSENFSIRRKPGLGTQPQVYYIV